MTCTPVATQLTTKPTSTVSLPVTVTGRGFCPATVQLAATSLRATAWAPLGTLEITTVSFTGTVCGEAPSTMTLYPSRSTSPPVVVTDTRTVPTVGALVSSHAATNSKEAAQAQSARARFQGFLRDRRAMPSRV